MRTTNASATTPAVSARPMEPISDDGLSANPANTAVMMVAADTTTTAVRPKPSSTASTGSRPRTCASCMRETRNTW